MKKIITIIILTTLLTINSFGINAAENIFTDVSDNHWAKDNIEKLVQLGIVNGYKDGSFKPDNNINIDAFIKLAVTSLGFTDIKNADGYWADNYINKALELNIIKEGQFDSYTRPITREEMASITAKALGNLEKKEDIQKDFEFIRNCIKDFYNIADKYLQDVVESYAYGLITGKTNGFDPKGNATRAEATTVIVRLLDRSCRKPIYIPPTVTKEDIKKDQDGKMYFDVIRYRDYKNKDERIATEINHKYRVYECPNGETTALQLMYAMDKVYKDNKGYVHLSELGEIEQPTGVVYDCLDSIEHSYDPVECVNHSEVDFYVKNIKNETPSAYNIVLNYKVHDMTYMERFAKYEKMFDTMLHYLYEDKFQIMKDNIKQILQVAENMNEDRYRYTIKMNDREMYIEVDKAHRISFDITIKGGKVEHFYPVEENKPNFKKASNTNEYAPNFSLEGIDGKIHTLAEYKGKKTYILFWSSWCSHCVKGLNETNNLANQDNDFEVLTIVSPNFTKEKNKEEFKKWFDSLNYNNMIVLLDNNGTIAKEYGITAYPTNIYISNGMIVKKNTGHVNNTQIAQEFEAIK